MAEVESLIRDSIQSIVKGECSELSPPGKKQKLSGEEERKPSTEERLESRLIGVLSCVICFDLPSGFIYQVYFLFYKDFCYSVHLLQHSNRFGKNHLAIYINLIICVSVPVDPTSLSRYDIIQAQYCFERNYIYVCFAYDILNLS